MEQVAAAPIPPPPVIVIVGATVYPEPAFISNISLRDVIFPTVVIIPTALAGSFAGESVKVITGAEV